MGPKGPLRETVGEFLYMVKNPSRSQGMREDDSEFRYRKVQEAMLLYGMRPQGRGIRSRKASEVCWAESCSGHRARKLPRPRREVGSRQGISKFASAPPSRVNHFQQACRAKRVPEAGVNGAPRKAEWAPGGKEHQKPGVCGKGEGPELFPFRLLLRQGLM